MRAPAERDALVAGMTLVPALLSRNRNFALFEDHDVRRARVRAALLRGIVRQLTGAHGRVEGIEVVPVRDALELRYRVPGLRVDRRAILTDLEFACVAYLASRASVVGMTPTEEDRARIDAALRRLSAGLKIGPVDILP